MAYELTWMPAVLVGAGLKVAEVPGWPNRGRGPAPAMRGVMLHHTAGAKQGNMPSLSILTNGREDLPGPLCQLGLGRDGTFYLVAAGRANHAGAGNWQGVTTGNSSFIGIECENDGKEAWPAVQLDAMERGTAALLAYMKQPAAMCCGHKEYALPKGRKPDPHTIDMDALRARIADRMAGRAAAPALIPRADTDGRPTLRRGSSSNPPFVVKEAQGRLGITGSDADGVFGPMTEAAVRQFQRSKGLVPDGIVGPRTWKLLLGQ